MTIISSFFRHSRSVILVAALLGLATPALARGVPDGFADLAERLMPAVVNISTSQTVDTSATPPGQPPFNDFFEEFFRQRQDPQAPSRRKVSSLGSGFVIDPDGIIITNNHVIEEADEIVVNFSDGSKYDATVIGRDPKTDIAVLKINADKALPFVPMGNSSAARVGDWVIAIGNPFGLGGSLSAGVISAINRDINAGPYDSFIQTDAAINRGNSGGPLFNLDGEVIGVNSAIISPSGGSVGIGFSIPADLASSVIAQLRKFGETRRGWLGVRIQAVTDDLAESLGLDKPRGALVSEVSEDGPAKKGGIRVGDVIVRFNGTDVPQMRDLPRIVADTEINKKVRVEVIRRGKSKTLTIVTGRLEEPLVQKTDAAPKEQENNNDNLSVQGLTLADIDDALRERFQIDPKVKGAVLLKVASDSHAAEKGLRPGDVISEVEQRETKGAAEVVKAINDAAGDGMKKVLLLVTSRAGIRYVVIDLMP